MPVLHTYGKLYWLPEQYVQYVFVRLRFTNCTTTGHKASLYLADSVLTTFAETLQVEDGSSFIEAAFDQLDSHRQYYAQDIWDLWNTNNKEDFNKKLRVMGIGGIGEKVLRKILNPVLGVSLEKPAIKREAGQDFQAFKRKCEEAEKEWEKVPERLELASYCSICVAASLQSMKPIFDEFVLS